MNTYLITFPSIHGPGRGQDFSAEVKADSEARATRAALEACASQGIALDHVVIANVSDLKGAELAGLKLRGCRLQAVDLSGVSLRGADIQHTEFDHVHADITTRLDGAMLEHVQFIGCSLNGMVAKGLQGRALRFEGTTAIGIDVENAYFVGVRSLSIYRGQHVIPSVLVSWRIRMAYLGAFENAPFVIDAADATDAEKAAARTLIHSSGHRPSAQDFLDRLEAQAA